jgi:hypothetical protein
LRYLAYRAITVFGATFQLLLLASQISYLMYANGSAYFHYRSLTSQCSVLVFCNVTTPYTHSSTNLSDTRQNLRFFLVARAKWNTFCPAALFPFKDHKLCLISEVYKVWALPVSLATTSGIVVYFLFLGVLRCFSSPGYRSPSLYIQLSANRHYSAQVSPFGNLRFIA